MKTLKTFKDWMDAAYQETMVKAYTAVYDPCPKKRVYAVCISSEGAGFGTNYHRDLIATCWETDGHCRMSMHAERHAMHRMPEPEGFGAAILLVSHAPCFSCLADIADNPYISKVYFRKYYKIKAKDFRIAARRLGIEVSKVTDDFKIEVPE